MHSHSHSHPLTAQRRWLTEPTASRLRLTTPSSSIECALRVACVCHCIVHSLHIAVPRSARRSGAGRDSA